jgi:hypothetical protein
VVKVYSRALGSLFVTSYDSQGYGGGILTRFHMGSLLVFKVKVKVMLRLMVSQSVCLGVGFTLELVARYYFLSESCCLVCGAPSLTRGQVCLLSVNVSTI